VNLADIDLLEKHIHRDDRIAALESEVERLALDNHILRQEIERLQRKPENER
jgi:cell division protein FtsB